MEPQPLQTGVSSCKACPATVDTMAPFRVRGCLSSCGDSVTNHCASGTPLLEQSQEVGSRGLRHPSPGCLLTNRALVWGSFPKGCKDSRNTSPLYSLGPSRFFSFFNGRICLFRQRVIRFQPWPHTEMAALVIFGFGEVKS